MWTDTFQGAMMFATFLVVIIKGTIDAGGVKNVFTSNYDSGRIEFFKYDYIVLFLVLIKNKKHLVDSRTNLTHFYI